MKHNKVSIAELALALNVSKVTINKYRKCNYFVYNENGTINIEKTKEKVNKNIDKSKQREKRNKQDKKDELVENFLNSQNKNEENNKEETFAEKVNNGTITAEDIQNADFNVLKNLETFEKYRKTKLDNDERERKLISIESVEMQTELIGKTLLDGLSALPSRLCVVLAGMGDISEIEIYLKNEINSIMLETVEKLNKIVS